MTIYMMAYPKEGDCQLFSWQKIIELISKDLAEIEYIEDLYINAEGVTININYQKGGDTNG